MATALLTAGFARSGFDANTFRQLDLFGEVFEQVHENYVSDPDDKDLIEGAIDGMLLSLDPHSSYLSGDDYERMQEQTRGSFAGLGIQVTQETEGAGRGLVKVISPIDDTPAARAGFEPGDLIYEIDGQSVFGMTLEEAIGLMKGPKGTSVEISLIREDVPEPLDFTIVRDIVTVSPVSSRLEENDIGYIRLTGFTSQTERKMREAIRELDREAGGLRGLVLDLRNNPGGLLDQAVGVSDAFLDGGEIVSTRGRRSKDSMREVGDPGQMIAGVPIVVLVNGGSASASEIVAGALQDRNRALLLGTKTFGKGSVQTVLPLQNGANGALRLTTARYYTPSGRSIQAQGIVPDIVMPITHPGEEEPEKRRREADLPGALDVPEGDEPTTAQQILLEGQESIEEQERDEENASALFVEPTECPAEKDCQLDRALELLRDRPSYAALLADAGAIERQ
ncbi:peptidase S41A [Parvularcula bermudensis HTCC2503]|uniref:Peptidase S41A n=1 Tax=Parvularcula bermudensis (strain ATCC BAA-594 / HTCC2503 / KCTC 12087) TaxID=314260 RepID=E0TFU2_PARBH|nr:S41 family peptidase [Parvularcula bermudensis]ADM09107.1 peptidase S41A [Parvularcula bermudensis HTCC2503]